MKRSKTRNIIWNKRNRIASDRGEWTVYVTKSFSVSRYGTKEKALEKAVKFRDELYKSIYREFKEMYVCENVNYREIKRGDKIYYYYRAKYYDVDAVSHEKCFNISVLGEHKALELAKKTASPGKRWDLISTYLKEDNPKK